MKKLLRKTAALALLAVSSTSLSSCGEMGFEFWSSFGAAYTQYLQDIVDDVNEVTGYNIKHRSKGSYDGIRTAVNAARTSKHHPSLLTGYPDHFAEYLGGKILVPLNSYIEEYNAKNNCDLLSDYYEDYMSENKRLDVYTKADGSKEPAITALPFNKSTELMGYNGTFVKYCETIDPELGNVPATWQEWRVKGPKYRDILYTLIKPDDDTPGKVLYFNQYENGDAYDFAFEKGNRTASLDFTRVKKAETSVIGWDSTDNMFITLLHQWGSEYTELPETEMDKDPRRRKGHVKFYSPENKQTTIDCLQYFNEMSHDGIFRLPAQFGGSYCSDAFAANKCMFMLCSSGGLSYNTDSWSQRFRVAPLPYYDDGQTVRKYVISQGANITLTNQGGEEMIQKAFDTMVLLTQGEYQARWCLNTGYYPCSKSATDHELYKAFLENESYDIPAEQVAYREGSVLNQGEYMDKDKGWTKFVDPAFSGSSTIRLEAKKIFEKVFINVKLNDDYTIASGNTMTYESILEYALEQFKSISSIVVDR